MLSSNEYTLKDAIEKMLHEFKIKHKIDEIRIRNSWESIMGKSASARTVDIRLSNRVLYVKLESAVLRNELSMSKEKIIKRLNEDLGEKAIDSVILK